MRQGKKAKNRQCPAEQIGLRRMTGIPQSPPTPEPVQGCKEKHEAPWQHADQEHRDVVKHAPAAMQVPACKANQTFVPEGIAGKARVAERDCNEPGEAGSEKQSKPRRPSQSS